MSNIHNRKSKMAEIALARLGKTISVVGVEMIAVIGDDEYEDETGLRRELTASFHFNVVGNIAAGDAVYYEGKNYKVGRLPRLNTLDQLYTVELKNA